jgi:hypothetical protein
MSKRHYVVGTLTFAILLAGIVIGSVFFSTRTVHAQAAVEEVTPSLSTGTVYFQTMLTHRVVADQIIVGDHDMGKLLENLMNLMSRKSNSALGATYTQAELQAVVDGSKLETPIRIKAPPAQNQPPKEDKK